MTGIWWSRVFFVLTLAQFASVLLIAALIDERELPIYVAGVIGGALIMLWATGHELSRRKASRD